MSFPKISNQIYKDDALSVLDSAYNIVGPNWMNHQMEWMYNVYGAFKDHDKFLIIIHLTKKTLDFYSRNFIKLTYEEFYSKASVEIEKFNIIEIAKEINIPKESARRKVVELENSGVIKRQKKKIIIDRSAFPYIKPIKSVVRISRFLSMLSELLLKEKILRKKFSTVELEKIIKDNFSYIWKIYYEFQIPTIISYKKVFRDIETFHIFSVCLLNQFLFSQKKNSPVMARAEFFKDMVLSNEIPGINAMSISEITGIPRATVVRKLKTLVIQKKISINYKKHYKLTDSFVNELMPLHKNLLERLADFSTKVYNLAIL